MQFFLAALALSPWLLRLFSKYLSEFSVGPTGVTGKTRQAVVNKDEIDRVAPLVASNEAVKFTAPNEFDSFLAQTKKVLRTLWKFQVEQFGPADIRRWGFSVGAASPDYHGFSLGVLELMKKNFISIDPKGFVFLTNLGVEFCQKNNASISAYPDYYSHFAN